MDEREVKADVANSLSSVASSPLADSSLGDVVGVLPGYYGKSAPKQEKRLGNSNEEGDKQTSAPNETPANPSELESKLESALKGESLKSLLGGLGKQPTDTPKTKAEEPKTKAEEPKTKAEEQLKESAAKSSPSEKANEATPTDGDALGAPNPAGKKPHTDYSSDSTTDSDNSLELTDDVAKGEHCRMSSSLYTEYCDPAKAEGLQRRGEKKWSWTNVALMIAIAMGAYCFLSSGASQKKRKTGGN